MKLLIKVQAHFPEYQMLRQSLAWLRSRQLRCIIIKITNYSITKFKIYIFNVISGHRRIDMQDVENFIIYLQQVIFKLPCVATVTSNRTLKKQLSNHGICLKKSGGSLLT